MGLLDNDQLIAGLSLLQGASAKPVRTGIGEAGLLALMNVQNARDQRAQRAAQEEERKMRQAQMQMQQEQMKMQLAERQRQQQQQVERSNYLGAMDANAGPAIRPTLPGLLARNFSLKEASALMPEARAPKLKSVDQMRGPDGKMINVALFEDGSHKVLPYGVKPEIALQNLGDRAVAIDKNDIAGGTAFNFGVSPDARLSADTTRRGQNMVDARAREANSIANTTGKPPAGYRWKADGTLEPIPGGPADQKVGGPGAKAQDAKDVLEILDMAEPLLKKSTGSYAGTGIDMLASGVGISTQGAQAAAELKALQGALVSKMPKMSGPQSDKDVQLYREMAGQIGDSTLPIGTRQAAVRTIRALNQKYAGVSGPAPTAGPSLDDLLKKYGN